MVSALPAAPPLPDRVSMRSSASISSRSSLASRPKREIYSIEWQDGLLGLTLCRNQDNLPCVRRLTGKGGGAHGIDMACVGDILVEINGASTDEMGYQASILAMRSIEKPALLKFRRPRHPPCFSGRLTALLLENRPSDATMYDIVWYSGQLGLKFQQSATDVTEISRVTGRGSASGIDHANVGDQLVAINGLPVVECTFENTLRLITNTAKPVVLRFRPCNRETEIRGNPWGCDAFQLEQLHGGRERGHQQIRYPRSA
ncbi:hypothetical protein AeRB84_004498 [Aphanomyces euteiches]|nr:hypothetical protein AeRB84_004498 [Aphanomyces euteiches]